MARDENKTLTLAVPRGSNLDLILRGFNGAVNKLADSIGGGLQAIALAQSTPQDNSQEVKEQIARLKSSRTELDTAIKQHNEGD